MISQLTLLLRYFGRAALAAGIFATASASAQLATPVFSPAGGIYSSTQSVTLTSATTGVSVVYTTDGSIPAESGGTVTHGTLYSGAITINSTTTLSAMAFEHGYPDSAVAIDGFTLRTAIPTFVPLSSTASDFEAFPLVTIPTSNVLYNFPVSASDGGTPAVGLIQGSDGNFYGMTSAGGAGSLGTVFKITPEGSLITLVSFSGTSGAFLGSAPHGSLVQGSDGNFYGTTGTGGAGNFGTVFKMTPAGTFTTLVAFTGTTGAFLGSTPFAGLVQGSDGNFYGSTEFGGTANYGTVFKLTLSPSPTLTTLLSFDGVNNGRQPEGSFVQGTDGNFYGATVYGLIGSTFGTVYSITSSGVLTNLVTFTGPNGAYPHGGLIQGSDGNFYGTTNGDSVNNDGTVFKLTLTPSPTLTTLVSFTGPNGAYPRSYLVQGTDGNIYGATNQGGSSYVSQSAPGNGTIFQMTPAGILTTLVSSSSTNGNDPFGGLVQGSDGNFYGVTQSGGTSNAGVFFQLIVPATAAPVFSPAAGTYTSAQTVTITSATSGATIRYTTDGSTPTQTTGSLYSGPLTISGNVTLQTIAYEPGFTNSPVTSGTYTINIPTPTPTPTPAGGGGGAPSYWFLGLLAFAGILRWRLRQTQARSEPE
jgi:MYXO-CTERM domain-containing protein